MTSVFSRLCGGDQAFQNLSEFLSAIHETDDAELEKQARSLSGNERQIVCIKVADTIRQRGARSALETAALLFLFESSAYENDRGELFEMMELETGIGRTQLYRLIAVHRKFGKMLFAEPQVIGMFVCESLKLLSEATVPDAAREEAMELARQKQRITIAEAQAIRRRHRLEANGGEKDGNQSKASNNLPSKNRQAISSRWLWRFESPILSICIGQSKEGKVISADAIVKGLEAALEKARKEFLSSTSTSLPSQVT